MLRLPDEARDLRPGGAPATGSDPRGRGGRSARRRRAPGVPHHPRGPGLEQPRHRHGCRPCRPAARRRVELARAEAAHPDAPVPAVPALAPGHGRRPPHRRARASRCPWPDGRRLARLRAHGRRGGRQRGRRSSRPTTSRDRRLRLHPGERLAGALGRRRAGRPRPTASPSRSGRASSPPTSSTPDDVRAGQGRRPGPAEGQPQRRRRQPVRADRRRSASTRCWNEATPSRSVRSRRSTTTPILRADCGRAPWWNSPPRASARCGTASTPAEASGPRRTHVHDREFVRQPVHDADADRREGDPHDRGLPDRGGAAPDHGPPNRGPTQRLRPGRAAAAQQRGAERHHRPGQLTRGRRDRRGHAAPAERGRGVGGAQATPGWTR